MNIPLTITDKTTETVTVKMPKHTKTTLKVVNDDKTINWYHSPFTPDESIRRLKHKKPIACIFTECSYGQKEIAELRKR